MRIGVISDTHGSLTAIDRCILRAGDVDAWFHLGDIAPDARYLAEKSGKPVYFVYGNCDGRLGGECPEDEYPEEQKLNACERVVTVGGVRIFLCHGHYYRVDFNPYALSYRAEELGCAAALYGHTHMSELSALGSVLLLNPGSPARPRGMRKPSFAILRVLGGKVNADIITL